MKIRCQYTIEVDPEKVRAEFGQDKDELTEADIRHYFSGYGEDAVLEYIRSIGVGVQQDA